MSRVTDLDFATHLLLIPHMICIQTGHHERRGIDCRVVRTRRSADAINVESPCGMYMCVTKQDTLDMTTREDKGEA